MVVLRMLDMRYKITGLHCPVWIGTLFWGAAAFCFGTMFEMIAAMMICCALCLMWEIVFRYDKAYDAKHKDIFTK